MTTFRLVPERDVIWTAGLFDGEGTCYLRRAVSEKSISHTVEIEISMTNKPTIERLYKIFGEIGSFRPAKRLKKKENHRQAWRWCVSSNQALMVLELIHPYLTAKKDEVELALQFRTLRNTPGHRRLDPVVLAKRENMYRELREMKKIEYTVD